MNDFKPITLSRSSSPEERQMALQQIYAQVLERQPYKFEHKLLAKHEKEFLSGKLGVRHFLHALACSQVYQDSFYYNCSNLKFIELCFKHFLGRAVLDHAEIKVFTDILTKRGYEVVISEILGSEEYRKAFGGFTVPHARTLKFYPSTQNFLQSEIIKHEHVGQHGRIVPTLYWHQLGLDCTGGVCRHPEVDGDYRIEEDTVKPDAVADEIEELLKMLQEDDAKRALHNLSDNQRSLLRNLVGK
ncbi:phycobilisome rod-core linker polypeptide [Tumidithrix helvetica PCC 7403]|uniref:phycobilisome rod-core linker polypeptide n=1 Tax=Tumidithrix helvetica TaxID=3457545 RepID=UPI003C8F1FC2